jgi:AcrR family transcriptional regulator
MAREYRMRKRAEARDETRERIVRATMQVHDEKGVAPATFAEIAERAGVGQATVSRHFPTLGDLVQACGAHVWAEMQPPVPDAAASVFEGAAKPEARLTRLVEELNAFYERGAHRLALAARDRELVPELDQFLMMVDAGVEALVREALTGRGSDREVPIGMSIMSFPVWSALRKAGLPAAEFAGFWQRILECSLKAAQKA